MTDHLTRATAIPRHERAAAFAELAEKCYGKDWRKVLADSLRWPVTKVYQKTGRGRVDEFALAYLMSELDKAKMADSLLAERLRSALADLEA